MRSDKISLLLLLLPGLLWLFAFVVIPFGFAGVMSFWTSGMFGLKPDFQFGNYALILGNPLYATLILKTLRVALVATLLSLAISYPIAYFLAFASGRAKIVLTLLLFLPFWTSYVVRSFIWLPILGTNGAINRILLATGIIDQPIGGMLYNEGAIYVGLVYVYTLFMTLPIYLAIEKIDPRLLEAAADLGAKPFWVFLRIVLPLSWPGVVSGCVMVFLLAMSSYVTPQMLGGPSGIMVSGMIAAQFQANNNWALGATLALVLSAITFAILIVAGRWVGIRQIFTAGRG
ncbi:ABC transporter permease [Rhodoplanes sp. Z2-YC6860]|uniref:ABC transporter permease n=1 Tax=Rhodoplanes sp. Z2-YC6860 TaxID=674703 RepID=UPI00082FBC65|nr:ABC transporter permease [Rhodoplanes sp. Z2-YC6860]